MGSRSLPVQGHVAQLVSRAGARVALFAYSGPKAPGFRIQTRHHFRFDSATGVAL